jgi:hypothetical protein
MSRNPSGIREHVKGGGLPQVRASSEEDGERRAYLRRMLLMARVGGSGRLLEVSVATMRAPATAT